MLTIVDCKNAKSKDRAYKLGDTYGLFLLIKPNGKKYWRHRYSFAAQPRIIAYGVFPEVTLAEARDRTMETRRLIREGIDPAQLRRKTRQAAKDSTENTFEAVAKIWHEHNKPRWSEGHAGDILHRLEKELLPLIGGLPLAEITPRLLHKHIQAIQDRGANEMARRVQQYANQIFCFAIATERADRNPAAEIKSLLRPYKKGHYRALAYKELPSLLEKLEKNDARLMLQTRLSLKLMLLTFVRTGELVNARWREFDLEAKLWVIPAERMKMRREHVVSLSDQAIAILKQLREANPYNAKEGHEFDWVFPHVSDPRRAMSNATMLGGIRRMGFKEQTTVHGFRAMAMTALKERLGYPHEVVDRQLAHAPADPLGRAYDRAEYLDQREKMMQHWANHIDVLAQGKNIIISDFRKAG
ncbi:MAG: integrase arm-type DNA-binding domain-containing protein [Bdellovibrionales bacterium]|jgi:integrase